MEELKNMEVFEFEKQFEKDFRKLKEEHNFWNILIYDKYINKYNCLGGCRRFLNYMDNFFTCFKYVITDNLKEFEEKLNDYYCIFINYDYSDELSNLINKHNLNFGQDKTKHIFFINHLIEIRDDGLYEKFTLQDRSSEHLKEYFITMLNNKSLYKEKDKEPEKPPKRYLQYKTKEDFYNENKEKLTNKTILIYDKLINNPNNLISSKELYIDLNYLIKDIKYDITDKLKDFIEKIKDYEVIFINNDYSEKLKKVMNDNNLSFDTDKHIYLINHKMSKIKDGLNESFNIVYLNNKNDLKDYSYDLNIKRDYYF